MVEISEKDLMDLLWMARRYADGRCTYIPSSFNLIYQTLREKYPSLFEKEKKDETVEFFPYAQDGMYEPKTGMFDARPKQHSESNRQGTISQSATK